MECQQTGRIKERRYSIGSTRPGTGVFSQEEHKIRSKIMQCDVHDFQRFCALSWASGNGLVPLGRFYSQPENAEYHFTETREYLRQIGALQESGTGDLHVRIANYMTGPSNCIASSSYYSVCCLNECEGLMNELEAKVLAPTTTAHRLLDLVVNMSSATVDAPRQIPSALEQKLHLIAKQNDGQVPLHGRLFAQWMHYAYPHECPYPQIAEDAAVLTPSHWHTGLCNISTLLGFSARMLSELRAVRLPLQPLQNLARGKTRRQSCPKPSVSSSPRFTPPCRLTPYPWST